MFNEERERPVLFVVDCGSSMQFGTQGSYKSVAAAKVAALLAWSAIAHGDKVGAILFAGEQHQEIRPIGGKQGIFKLLNNLVNWNKDIFESGATEYGSKFDDVVLRLKRVARPGSLVYIISDFSLFDKKAENYLAQIAKHCDLVMINVYDVMERQAPPSGKYMLTDGEHTGEFNVDTKKVPEALKSSFENHQNKLKHYSIKHGIYYFSLTAIDDMQQILRDKLTHRMISSR